MIGVNLYFQVHQPYRLRSNYSFFDIGRDHFYEDDVLNAQIMRRVADRCYLPTNALIQRLIEQHGGAFKCAFSISGCALDQFQQYCPEVIESFQRLAETGCVEFVAETYYHSLASLFDHEEFAAQVEKHAATIEYFFGKRPTTFRNTELVYDNSVAQTVAKMGFTTCLAEGADQVLGWRTPNFLYRPTSAKKLALQLRNYQLSDDLAFRFGDPHWEHYPLTVDRFASWIHSVNGDGELVNIFMDYETFGEHHAPESGIFSLLGQLPEAVLRSPDFGFVTPSEATATLQPMAKMDVPYTTSWADLERDTTAWMGASMQDQALALIYSLKRMVQATGDEGLLNIWRRLQTSDHFYYMCTKWFSDGDVHRTFTPYRSPHDAFITYMNVVNDLILTLKERGVDVSAAEALRESAASLSA